MGLRNAQGYNCNVRNNPFTTEGWMAIGYPLAVLAASVLAGLLGLYVIVGPDDNGRAAPRAGAPAPGKSNSGEMAAFVFKKEREPLAEVAFADGKGQPRTLKDWHGRVVLLNLWATWCAPCRKEMPGLARLQKEMGSARFEVVALAVDRAGADAAGKFLASIGAGDLALYIDPTARAGIALRAAGMPTTLLIDAAGREIGRLTGPAEWDSPEAKRLISAHLQ